MLALAVPASEVGKTHYVQMATGMRPAAYSVCPQCGYVGEVAETSCARYRCFEPVPSYGQIERDERAPTRLWAVRRSGDDWLFFPPEHFGRVRAARGSRRVKQGMMEMQKPQATPTFPPPGQGEELEGKFPGEVRGSYRRAAEYQIRLLDRLSSPLRETLAALQRVQVMRLVAEVEQSALDEVLKTAPAVERLVNTQERSLRQLAEAILGVERNIIRLVEG